jgi:hypothetical protein
VGIGECLRHLCREQNDQRQTARYYGMLMTSKVSHRPKVVAAFSDY